MTPPDISFDPALASPMVRVFASILKLAVKNPKLASKASRASGRLGLKSRNGPHAATIIFNFGTIHLINGLQPDCDVIITSNFDKTDDQPDTTGLLGHPLFAMKVLPLLNATLPNWQVCAEKFWVLTQHLEAMPKRLKLTCSSGESLTLGEKPEKEGQGKEAHRKEATATEIIGSVHVLQKILLGHTILITELIAGRVKFRGELKHMAGINEGCQKLMLDEPTADLAASTASLPSATL